MILVSKIIQLYLFLYSAEIQHVIVYEITNCHRKLALKLQYLQKDQSNFIGKVNDFNFDLDFDRRFLQKLYSIFILKAVL